MSPTLYHTVPGIPVQLSTRQAVAFYSKQGYPPRAMVFLLKGVGANTIRQNLSRARQLDKSVPRFLPRKTRTNRSPIDLMPIKEEG